MYAEADLTTPKYLAHNVVINNTHLQILPSNGYTHKLRMRVPSLYLR